MSVHSNHMDSHFAPWSMAEVAPLSIMVMTVVVVMSMVVMVAVVVVVVMTMIMVNYMIPTSTTTGRTPQLQQWNHKYTKQQTVIKQHNEIGSVYGTAWLVLLFSICNAIQILLALTLPLPEQVQQRHWPLPPQLWQGWKMDFIQASSSTLECKLTRALEVRRFRATVTHLDTLSMWYTNVLHVILEHRWCLCLNSPWERSRTIVGAINRASKVRSKLPLCVTLLSKGLQSVLEEAK